MICSLGRVVYLEFLVGATEGRELSTLRVVRLCFWLFFLSVIRTVHSGVQAIYRCWGAPPPGPGVCREREAGPEPVGPSPWQSETFLHAASGSEEVGVRPSGFSFQTTRITAQQSLLKFSSVTVIYE